MKSHNEMYRSLLSRYNEYQEKKVKRIRAVRRIIPVLACFCVVAILGLGYWNHMDKIPIIPETVNEDITSSIETTTAIVTESTSVSKPVFTTTTVRTQRATSSTSAATEPHTENNTTSIAITSPVSKVTTDALLVTQIPQTTVISTAVNITTTKLGGFNLGGDNDLGITHTTTTSGDNGFVYTTTTTVTTELVTTEPVTTTTTNSGDNNVPSQPMNEKYPLGFLDGDITMYRNTYRISPDNVGEYIGIAGMRGLGPIYNAKAFKIKNIEATVAIAVKFEEDEGYYLYRNNNTSIDTIKELISPEE